MRSQGVAEPYAEVQLLQGIWASRAIEVPVIQTEDLFGLRTSCSDMHDHDMLLEMSKPRYL